MLAVEYGYLDCVKEMDRIERTDFQIKNSQGETLIEVARREKHAMIVQYLEERMNQVVEDVADNALERMNLRDIAEELDNLDELEAVNASEKEIMKTRHESEKDSMQRRHGEENENMTIKQRD